MQLVGIGTFLMARDIPLHIKCTGIGGSWSFAANPWRNLQRSPNLIAGFWEAKGKVQGNSGKQEEERGRTVEGGKWEGRGEGQRPSNIWDKFTPMARIRISQIRLSNCFSFPLRQYFQMSNSHERKLIIHVFIVLFTVYTLRKRITKDKKLC